MSKLRYILIGINPVITLAGLKSYLHISSDRSDTELSGVLRQAVIRVQEYADVALLPCTIELESDGSLIKLYQHPVNSVTSVKDESGEDVSYTLNYRKTAISKDDSNPVVITYATAPAAQDVERLINYVYEMASAMWDGNTEEQNKVYQRIPINYR